MEGDGDIRSYIIDITRPRVFAKRSYDVIKTQDIRRSFKRSERRLRNPSEVSLTKYSLPGGDAVRAKALKRDELILPFRRYEKQQNCNKHKQKLGIHIYDKYKIISTDLRKRLHLENPPDDVFALTQIDEGFFKFVNGRPLAQSTSLYKSLKYLFHYQLRIRQEVGYRRDTFLNIEVNYKKEQERYDLTVQRVTDQAKYFDNFISDDYQKSMFFLDQWEEMKKIVNNKNAELQNLATEMFTITSRLILLDYKYNVLQKYGRFLYYLSPPSWRMHNREFALSVEIEAKGFDFGNSNNEDTFTVIFEKMKGECNSGMVKPVIYFTQPDDLMEVFETVEKQQLHHFTHVAQMAPHAKMLKRGIKSLRELLAQDSAVLANAIEGFESSIQFYDQRSNDLEAKFYKILYGMFYESVGTLEVLKFIMHLEFCYEKVFFEKPLNVDIVFMGKALEKFYMDYSKHLEAINSANLDQAISQCKQAEKLKHKRVMEAAKEIRCFERLKRELLIAFAPPKCKDYNAPGQCQSVVSGKSVKKKKKRVMAKLVKPVLEGNNRKSLTECEKEYLTLFTDWTENEDPANYLQSFSMTDEDK